MKWSEFPLTERFPPLRLLSPCMCICVDNSFLFSDIKGLPEAAFFFSFLFRHQYIEGSGCRFHDLEGEQMKTTHTLKASVRAERVQRLASAEDFFKGNMETSDWGGRGRDAEAEMRTDRVEGKGERIFVCYEGRATLSLLLKATLSSLSQKSCLVYLPSETSLCPNTASQPVITNTRVS